MTSAPFGLTPGTENNVLLPYVAELELEVDRLRKQMTFVEHAAREAVVRWKQACSSNGSAKTSDPEKVAVAAAAEELAGVLRDLHEHPGYHPTHDQVTAIAVRPLVEQIFRWHQRLTGASKAVLHLELLVDHVDWFPARLRHILDGLISNALRYRDPQKGESRVALHLSRVRQGYEFRVADNGVGIPSERQIDMLELFYRAAPAREAGLGVGLAVVKLLVERSGGSLTLESREGQGTSVVAVLPRFDIDDFLDVDVR